MATNSKQNVITAVAIIVALAAVVYAFVQTANRPADEQPATEVSQEETQTDESQEASYAEGEQNPVVLTIDGREVTRMEVMDNFASSESQLPEGANMERIFPLLQEQYMVAHLLDKAARNEGINGTNPEVAQRVEDARQKAIRAVYIDKMTDDVVTESEVRQAYDEIVGNAQAVEERRARHILVDTAEAANALILKLQNGGDFEALARENSTGPSAQNGGDLGYFAREEMVPAFAEKAFSMNVGDVSDEPVQTQFGYHVIKVLDVREREKPSFEEMRAQIEQQLRQAVIREKVQNLRESANVMVYDYQGNPIETPENQQAGDNAAADDANADAKATQDTEADAEGDAGTAEEETTTAPQE